MNIKDMKRSNWARCLRKDYAAKNFELDGYQGQMSLSVLRELTGPLTIHYPFGDVLIADKDYSWLQIALEDQFFWVTAMFDNSDRLIEIYIDINAGNCFANPDNPCFDDMYLDIVVLPNGMVSILDQDELEEALSEGVISKEACEHAELVCRRLYEYLCEHKDTFTDWCIRSYKELKSI